jgi:phosphoribosyl 1,2-cyclic phosphodiesterase
MRLIFLGSGGGRWVTITQRLKTGGFRIHGSTNIHIDPGPGALVSLRENGISPLKTDAVLVTHCHPDHYNDAEVLIEAMARGMTKHSGFLGGSKSVLNGIKELGPAISDYHRSKLNGIALLEPGKTFKVGDLKVKALKTRHSDPSCVGLKFYFEEGVLTYTSDTEYFEGIEEEYADSRVIIFNIIRPRSDRIPWHLCVDDAIRITQKIKPELAIMHHFGMKMLGREEDEARRMERETGVRTVPARDDLRTRIDKGDIEIWGAEHG